MAGVNDKTWILTYTDERQVQKHIVFGKVVLQDNWVMILDPNDNSIRCAIPTAAMLLIEEHRSTTTTGNTNVSTYAFNPTVVTSGQ